MNIQTDHRFCDRLTCARVNAGCSRLELAERLHETACQPQTVAWLEMCIKEAEDGSGCRIHVTELAAIAKALNCSLLYLLGVEDG